MDDKDDHTWEHDMIEDIGHDTDSIIKMLGSEKMGESFDTGALMGMLANKGIDPGIVAMLDNCKRDGSWGDGGMLIVLFLILILGFGGNGGFFGNRGADGVAGGDRTVVNEANYSRMLDAIGGNREAIAGLAQTLNCDINSVQSALAGVDKAIAVNQGSVINAIQSCCCETNRSIERQGCQTRADIQDTRFLIQATASAQDNLVQGLFNAQNQYLAEQFCQIKSREDQREIQALRDRLAEQRDTANTLAILNAIANRDQIAFQGTAGTTAFNGTGTLS